MHLSDFTTDHSATPSQVDEPFLEQSVATPEDVGHFFPRGADMFGISVRGSVSIRQFLANRRVRVARAVIEGLVQVPKGRWVR